MEEPVGAVDPRDAQIAALTKKLAEYDKPAAGSSRFSGVKAKLKEIAAGVAAALTSPDAIKAEKSLAALVLARLAITLPATAVLIDLLLKALGAPSVSP